MAANLTGAPPGFADAANDPELKGPFIEKAHDVPTTYRRVYVWELPVRIFHWMNALVLLIMAATGLLIAYPFVLFNAQEPSQQYWFGWVRFLHFAAGYVFFFNFLFRMYWAVAGNKYANWRNFIPHNPQQFKGVWTVLTTDIIPIRPKRRLSMGHNELANFSYFMLFVLILLQSAVGFGLMSAMSGFFVAKMFGWVVPLLGGDAAARSWHHVLMWLFMIFTVIHVYLVFFHDWIEGRGVTSSIIGGWKFRKMKTFSENKTLVLGIGNILLGDEGIGVHVIEELRGEDFGENVELLDGGTGSFTLLEPMQSASRIILIDATLDGESPGDVRRLTPRYSSDYPKTLTAHDIGLKDLLDAFYLSGKKIPEVTLFAVTIPEFHELSTELSDDLKPVAARVAAMVRKEIAAGASIEEASAAA